MRFCLFIYVKLAHIWGLAQELCLCSPGAGTYLLGLHKWYAVHRPLCGGCASLHRRRGNQHFLGIDSDLLAASHGNLEENSNSRLHPPSSMQRGLLFSKLHPCRHQTIRDTLEWFSARPNPPFRCRCPCYWFCLLTRLFHDVQRQNFTSARDHFSLANSVPNARASTE